jgi:hypothetical protein
MANPGVERQTGNARRKGTHEVAKPAGRPHNPGMRCITTLLVLATLFATPAASDVLGFFRGGHADQGKPLTPCAFESIPTARPHRDILRESNRIVERDEKGGAVDSDCFGSTDNRRCKGERRRQPAVFGNVVLFHTDDGKAILFSKAGHLDRRPIAPGFDARVIAMASHIQS